MALVKTSHVYRTIDLKINNFEIFILDERVFKYSLAVEERESAFLPTSIRPTLRPNSFLSPLLVRQY